MGKFTKFFPIQGGVGFSGFREKGLNREDSEGFRPPSELWVKQVLTEIREKPLVNDWCRLVVKKSDVNPPRLIKVSLSNSEKCSKITHQGADGNVKRKEKIKSKYMSCYQEPSSCKLWCELWTS